MRLLQKIQPLLNKKNQDKTIEGLYRGKRLNHLTNAQVILFNYTHASDIGRDNGCTLESFPFN